MSDKIYLGRSESWGGVYIYRHEWHCNWYWAFGYLGNRNCHFHINSLIDHPKRYDPEWTDVSRHFASTWLTQSDWWVLRDLFIQAYALKKAAETYRFGGHQTDKARELSIIDAGMAARLNVDLETLLDRIWRYVERRYAETR